MRLDKTCRLFILIFVALCLSLPSCSSDSPTTSDLTPETGRAVDVGHNLMGLYRAHFETGSFDALISTIRSAESHFNVTAFLFPPHCSDCFKIQIDEWDLINNLVTATVTVKNFTKQLTGYDVRGIVYPSGDYILLNAHAYTFLYAPPEIETPAGFRAYKTEHPNRILLPGESATEPFVISFPEGAGFIDLVYAIDASWPDHCPEAYDISDFEQGSLDTVQGSATTVMVTVLDWQNDTSAVSIDTEIFGGGEIALENITGDTWSGEISNVDGVPPGEYPAMITAEDSVTDIRLYQWVNVKVSDFSDTEPPVWIGDEGITELHPGLQGVLVYFGLAEDPSLPVTYNLYWAEGNILDFDTANIVVGIEASPYLLEGLNSGWHVFCVRAQDGIGNETTNTLTSSAEIGVHPNIFWTEGPEMKVGRGKSGSFVHKDSFYVLGGSATGVWFDTVERYDFAEKSWSSPWSLPDARDSFGIGTDGEYAFVFGGRHGETDVTDDVKIIDIATGGWLKVAVYLPTPLADMGCTFIDGRFFISGGRNFNGSEWEYYRTSYTYEPIVSPFEGETDLEYETAEMGFAAGKDYVMTCGGYPARADTLFHYPGTKSWQFKAELPFGRTGNVSVLVDDWFYSIGGTAGWMEMDDVDVYDVKGDKWHSILPVPVPRAYATASTDGNYIYVAGGLRTVGPAYLPLTSFAIGKIF